VGSSTLYTVGTVLNHARDNGLEVDVLVSGLWLSGLVAAVDGFGVVLASDGDQHAVIRMEAVSAVRIAEGIVQHSEIPAGAHPMPGPRTAGDDD
jgi:sRNA-binding regulator protein Hfq